MKNKLLVENIIKNILIIVIALLCINPITKFLSSVDPKSYDSILLFANLILVAALFGNFSFSYEKSKLNKIFDRYLGHITTGFLMLSTALLFEISFITLSLKINVFYPLFALVPIFIYISIIGYDFWDLRRYKSF